MRQGAGRCVQSAHQAGPLPTLIIRLLWPSVQLHTWSWFSFQEPFVKQRSRKWGWFVQAWRMCLREPHLSRHADHAGSLPDGERGGSSSVGGRGEDRAEFRSAFVMNRDITGPKIYYWQNPGAQKQTDRWGFMARSKHWTYCSSSFKNEKVHALLSHFIQFL